MSDLSKKMAAMNLFDHKTPPAHGAPVTRLVTVVVAKNRTSIGSMHLHFDSRLGTLRNIAS